MPEPGIEASLNTSGRPICALKLPGSAVSWVTEPQIPPHTLMFRVALNLNRSAPAALQTMEIRVVLQQEKSSSSFLFNARQRS